MCCVVCVAGCVGYFGDCMIADRFVWRECLVIAVYFYDLWIVGIVYWLLLLFGFCCLIGLLLLCSVCGLKLIPLGAPSL